MTTTKLDDADIRRRQDGSIDIDHYARRAMTARAAAFAEQKTEFTLRCARLIAALLAWGGKPRRGLRQPAR